MEFQGTTSLFIIERKANDWFIGQFSCKVSHIKIFPYLLKLNIVFFASVVGDGSSYLAADSTPYLWFLLGLTV